MDDDTETEAEADTAQIAAIRAELAKLRQEHQDLDAAVVALQSLALPDQLRIARMKKRKLILRDQIAQLENRLTPDLIA